MTWFPNSCRSDILKNGKDRLCWKTNAIFMAIDEINKSADLSTFVKIVNWPWNDFETSNSDNPDHFSKRQTDGNSKIIIILTFSDFIFSRCRRAPQFLTKYWHNKKLTMGHKLTLSYPIFTIHTFFRNLRSTWAQK